MAKRNRSHYAKVLRIHRYRCRSKEMKLYNTSLTIVEIRDIEVLIML